MARNGAFKNGVLEIRVPKSEEAKSKKVRVQVEERRWIGRVAAGVSGDLHDE